jgi:hypothetical protein
MYGHGALQVIEEQLGEVFQVRVIRHFPEVLVQGAKNQSI